jgi:hypothetical protein
VAAGPKVIGSYWEAGPNTIGFAGSRIQLYWVLLGGRKDIQLAQPQMKNNYHHPIFVQYKKSLINSSPLYRMKKIT